MGCCGSGCDGGCSHCVCVWRNGCRNCDCGCDGSDCDIYFLIPCIESVTGTDYQQVICASPYSLSKLPNARRNRKLLFMALHKFGEKFEHLFLLFDVR